MGGAPREVTFSARLKKKERRARRAVPVRGVGGGANGAARAGVNSLELRLAMYSEAAWRDASLLWTRGRVQKLGREWGVARGPSRRRVLRSIGPRRSWPRCEERREFAGRKGE